MKGWQYAGDTSEDESDIDADSEAEMVLKSRPSDVSFLIQVHDIMTPTFSDRIQQHGSV